MSLPSRSRGELDDAEALPPVPIAALVFLFLALVIATMTVYYRKVRLLVQKAQTIPDTISRKGVKLLPSDSEAFARRMDNTLVPFSDSEPLQEQMELFPP